MKFILDSNVLILALHKPEDPELMENHKKSVEIFDSVLNTTNELYLTTTIIIETITVLSRIIGVKKTLEAYKKIREVVSEIYPLCEIHIYNTLVGLVQSGLYYNECLNNALKFGKIKKGKESDNIPGWKNGLTEIKLSGMDIFNLSYAKLKNLVLITDDWSLWYVAWKTGVKAYWLSGLTEKDIKKICKGKELVYPKKK